jgi:hypothetical protein
MAEDKKKPDEGAQPASGWTKAGLLFLFALVAFLAYDGYSNKWKYVKLVVYNDVLELQSTAGAPFELKAVRDFRFAEIPDSALALSEELVLRLDTLYRDSGQYRIYFRLSDAQSDRLEKLYQTLAMIDTGESVKKTVGDVQMVYRNVKRALGLDTTQTDDTVRVIVPDTAGAFYETKIASGTESDFARALGRSVAKNPQVLIGLGVGLAASAGFDLLGGQVFVAWSAQDRFGVDSLLVGARVGKWEGRDVDVLWVYGQRIDTLQSIQTDSLSAHGLDKE